MRALFLLCILLGCNVPLSKPTVLQVKEEKITIKDREVSISSVTQLDGTVGLFLKKGEQFHVQVENRLNVPTSLHWHGLLLPNSQDGTAFITQFPIYPGQNYTYQFPLVQSGTYWMHSHLGMQEQSLLVAPLILYEPNEELIADQEIVILLNDFSFQSAQEILQSLRCPTQKEMRKGVDLIDVQYDAFLANFRTLDAPQTVQIKPLQYVRLRFINASSSTNFFLSLGELIGKVIAVDGNKVQPLSGSVFELAVAQRIDVIVPILKAGIFPILAQGEGTAMQTGVILYTSEEEIPTYSSYTIDWAGKFSQEQEKQLHALHPLPAKKVDRKIEVILGGNMADYNWTINGQMWPEVTPLLVKKGERVEITFKNESEMAHPMHLHGHVFQVVKIDEMLTQGPMRDTVFIPKNSSVTIQFDADHPGIWPLDCHVLYHQMAGMFTVLRYLDFSQD